MDDRADRLPEDGDIGAKESAFSLTGLKSSDDVFMPVSVELAATDGTTRSITIIGVTDG